MASWLFLVSTRRRAKHCLVEPHPKPLGYRRGRAQRVWWWWSLRGVGVGVGMVDGRSARRTPRSPTQAADPGEDGGSPWFRQTQKSGPGKLKRPQETALSLPLTAAANDTDSFALVQLQVVTYCVIFAFSSVSVVSSSSTLGFGTLACESYGSSLAAGLALVEAACHATEESSIYRGRTYCADGQITRNNPRYHREWPLEARLEARLGAKLARVAQGRGFWM